MILPIENKHKEYRVLDDLKYIHHKDISDSLGIVEKQASQLRASLSLKGSRSFADITNVVYGAMGGSALAGEFVAGWLDLATPFEIVRDYDLPSYVDNKTLFIAASYSGNSEETLSALAQAEERQAQIAVITNGDKLQEVAEQKGYLLVRLPKITQPRYAVLSSVKALVMVLERTGLLRGNDALAEAADFVDDSMTSWLPTVPTAKNPAKQLAQELLGKSVVVYAGPKLYPTALKLKMSINENAKHVAWVGRSPEFYHNEFVGWSVAPPQKPYAVIELRSHLEHPRIQRRFEVAARLLSGLRPEAIVVEPKGKTLLEQQLWLAAFSDFVSIYLGLLNGVDPSSVELLEKFKKELGK